MCKFYTFSQSNYKKSIMISAELFPLRRFLQFTYAMSFFAFFSCISLTIYKDLDKTILIQCRAFNFLPSVSASIAFCFPQCYIWRFCFALTAVPRYIIAYLQLKFRIKRTQMRQHTKYILIERINAFIHFLELHFLFVLTYVSLGEAEIIHVYSYFGFILFSFVHMLLTVSVDYLWPRTEEPSNMEKILRVKRFRWFFINLLSFWISMYCYSRSTSLCEPLVYSIHSLFEYFVVLTNIVYHGVVIEEWSSEGFIAISF